MGAMVPVWDEENKRLFEVPDDQAADFQKQGWTVGDEATTTSRRHGWQGTLATVGLGALHGVSLGSSDYANGFMAKHLGGLLHAAGFSKADLATPERFNRSLDELKSEHYVANIGGEITGSIAPFLLTGGLAEGAVVAKGAAALARGVRTAEEISQATRLAKLGMAAGVGARVATGALSGGIQAGADADRYDTPLSGEQVLMSVGLGGIYTGVGEGVAYALPKIFTAGQRAVKRALDKASLDETAFTGVKGTEYGFEDRHPNVDPLTKAVYTAQLPDKDAIRDIRLARKYVEGAEQIQTHQEAKDFLEGKGKRDAAAGLRKYQGGKYEFNQPIKSGEFAGVHTLDEIADFVKRSAVAKTEAQSAADIAMRSDLSTRLGVEPEDIDAHIANLAENLSTHHQAVQDALAEQASTQEFAKGVKDHLDSTYAERNAAHRDAATGGARQDQLEQLYRIATQRGEEANLLKPPTPGPAPEAPTLETAPPLYEAKPFAGEAPTEPARPKRRPFEYGPPPPEPAGAPAEPVGPPVAEPAAEAVPPAAETPAAAPASPAEPVPLPPGIEPPAGAPEAAVAAPEAPPVAPASPAEALRGQLELTGKQIRELKQKIKETEVQRKVGKGEAKSRRIIEKKLNKPNAKKGREHVDKAVAAGTALESGSPEAIKALADGTHQEMFIRAYNKKFVIPKLEEHEQLIHQGPTKTTPDDAKLVIDFDKGTLKDSAQSLDEAAGKAAAAEVPKAEAPKAETPAAAPPKQSHKKGEGKKAKAAAAAAEEENARRAAAESDRLAEEERAAEETAAREAEAAKAKAVADKAAEKAAKLKDRMEKAAARAKRSQTRELNTRDNQQYRDAKRDYDDALKDHQKAKRAHEDAEQKAVKASESEARNVEKRNADLMREHAKNNAKYNSDMAAKLKAHQDRLDLHNRETMKEMRAVKPGKILDLEDTPLTEIQRMATEGQGPMYGLPHVEGLEDLGPHMNDFLEHVENHPDMPTSFRPRAFDPANFTSEITPRNLPDAEMPFMRSHKEYLMRRPHFVTAGIKAHYASLIPYVGHLSAAAYTIRATKHILGRYALNRGFQHEAAIMALTEGMTGKAGRIANIVVRQAFAAKAGDLGSQAYRARLDTLDSQYADASQGITELANNPQMAANGVTQALQPIAEHQAGLIGHTAAASGAALNHLASLIPPTPPGGALDNPIKSIPRSQKVTFMRAYQAVNDPATALANPTVGSVQAVEAVYPATLQEVRQRIIHDLADPKIAERVRRNPDLARRLSTILGQPLRRADMPASILSAQTVAQSQGITPPPPGAPGMAKPQQSATVNLTGSAAKNFVQSVATPRQADQLDNLGD